jgi:hypothetical protein
LRIIEGGFDVAAPSLDERWPDICSDGKTLKLAISPNHSHLWGSFKFGVYSGIMRSVNPPNKLATSNICLGWRGREDGGEGELDFDDSYNRITLTFSKDGNFKGRMTSQLGEFDIFGTPNNITQTNRCYIAEVKRWKREWRSITWARHETENQARWGKCVKEPAAERPAASDTTGRGAETDEDGMSVDGEGDYYDCGEVGFGF